MARLAVVLTVAVATAVAIAVTAIFIAEAPSPPSESGRCRGAPSGSPPLATGACPEPLLDADPTRNARPSPAHRLNPNARGPALEAFTRSGTDIASGIPVLLADPDPIAVLHAREWMGRCYLRIVPYLVDMDRRAIESGPAELKALRTALRERHLANCTGMDKDIERAVYAEMSKRKSAGADLLGINNAVWSIEREGAETFLARVRRVAESKEPLALFEVSAFFLNHPLGDIADAGDGRPADRQVMYYAWRLVGCDMGEDCGETHTEIWAACARFGRCAFSSYEDKLRQERPPAQLQRIQEVRRLLGNSLATGRWPEGFWSPDGRWPPKGG